MVREKCGNAKRLPFRWYEAAPLLLQKGSTEKLIAMAKQADASLQAEFGLPLGLVIIDTLGACTGFTKSGEETDPAVGQAIMDVLKAVSLAMDCFVLGVAHFGKDISRGTRGASTREDAGDVVWVCLGEREVSGNVVNTRLAVRKHKGGEQGLEFPFTLRTVEEPEPDEDGDPITTKVVDWLPAGATGWWRRSSAPRPLGRAQAPGSKDRGTATQASPDGESWPIKVLICQFRRTARWCEWSTRQSSGLSSTSIHRLMGRLSRSGRPGTCSLAGRSRGLRKGS